MQGRQANHFSEKLFKLIYCFIFHFGKNIFERELTSAFFYLFFRDNQIICQTASKDVVAFT